jgi:hypothetical protein
LTDGAPRGAETAGAISTQLLCSLKGEEEENEKEEEKTTKNNNLGVGLMRDVTFITLKLIKTFATPKVLTVPACLVVDSGLARGQKV